MTTIRSAIEEPVQHTGDIPQIALFGATLHAITENQCVDIVIESLRKGRGGWIATPNLDHLRRCVQDAKFAETIRDANLRVADGTPLIWASRLRGTPLPERVAGSNLITTLSRAAAEHSMSVYLLGGDPGTSQAAAQHLLRAYPKLTVAGTMCPPIGFEQDPAYMQDLADQLIACEPDLVFVALGSPKQENVIHRLRSILPRAWWVGVGISFSFLSGNVKRAPAWMQHCGLEWTHRLAQEPRRLAKRYLLHGIPFGLRLMAHASMSRVFPGRPIEKTTSPGWK